jgi:hypothetical protein
MTVPVTAENFPRAESDLYFSNVVKDDGFGKFHHNREPTPIDRQTVIRMNRDTLYSAAVFDLDAGPVTVILPDAGDRFMSMQLINENQYTLDVVYGAGSHRYTREAVGTRYFIVAIRTLVNATDKGDIAKVHALQDAISFDQPGGPGSFEVPDWDLESQKRVRDALAVLGATLPDSQRMFGRKEDVDPVRFLIGSAIAWGGNPGKEATYLNVTPAQNDGRTVHRLTVRDVPVEGFWSINVYNKDGYFEKNDRDSYSVNNLTAQKNPDGSVTVQFGGCDGANGNCIPITPGWNYLVRLYRPRAEVLDGRWTFPGPEPVG